MSDLELENAYKFISLESFVDEDAYHSVLE